MCLILEARVSTLLDCFDFLDLPEEMNVGCLLSCELYIYEHTSFVKACGKHSETFQFLQSNEVMICAVTIYLCTLPWLAVAARGLFVR